MSVSPAGLSKKKLLCYLTHLASRSDEVQYVRSLNHDVRQRLVDYACTVNERDQYVVPTGKVKVGQRFGDSVAVQDAYASRGRQPSAEFMVVDLGADQQLKLEQLVNVPLGLEMIVAL